MKATRIRTMREFATFDLVEYELETPVGPIRLERYVNKRGSFISARHGGRRPWLVQQIAEREISPIRRGRALACTIGRSATNGLWYGWGLGRFAGFASRQAATDFAASVS